MLAPNHIAVLSTLLDNEPAAVNMSGLVIDTDLRWRIVTALARAGVIDADGRPTPFIDAEAQQDPTAAGQRSRRRGCGPPAGSGERGCVATGHRG